MEYRSRKLLVIPCVLVLGLVALNGPRYPTSFSNESGKVIFGKYPALKSVGTNTEMETSHQHAWIKEQEDIQYQRVELLKKGCISKQYESHEFLRIHPPPSLFIVPSHRMMYCAVPKIASSSWKHLFLIVGRYVGVNSKLNQNKLNAYASKVLPRFSHLKNKTEKEDVIELYLKFLFVRHPFSRVLSVFKNKLDPNTKFERASHWQRHLGMSIIKRYRKLDDYKKVARNVKKNYDLKFEEFVKYVGDPKLKPRNGHWNEVYGTCRPCAVSYNFIGKIETMTTDVEYLMKKTKLADDYKFPSMSLSSPTNSSGKKTMESYYQNIPVQDLQNLYRRYTLDFKLFGYPKPDFVNGKIVPD
ncbi:carbohydrate sulfotransferase 10-like [Antedon mediterranea]|uniref:carbohydrate sulfotransferase 10-like n=1 Tax=Antedon mediterranea TaxID=105859 RepID=UPI003AF5FF54